MRKNKKIPKKMSVVATASMRFGAIIVFFFVMVILNLLSSSRYKQMMKTKGELEHEIAKLEDSRMRESLHWECMKTAEKLEAAMLPHGLTMKLPRAAQIVRMGPDGTPRKGQLSLALAKSRAGLSSAMAATSAHTSAPTQTPYRRARSRR